jgi:6-phosphogluconolactonase (cycloisomerase 2 family)
LTTPAPRYKAGRLSHEAFIPVAPGDGPRHFVFHPKLPVAYSGCELKSQVQVGDGRPARAQGLGRG